MTDAIREFQAQVWATCIMACMGMTGPVGVTEIGSPVDENVSATR
jgi:hypothetical protein